MEQDIDPQESARELLYRRRREEEQERYRNHPELWDVSSSVCSPKSASEVEEERSRILSVSSEKTSSSPKLVFREPSLSPSYGSFMVMHDILAKEMEDQRMGHCSPNSTYSVTSRELDFEKWVSRDQQTKTVIRILQQNGKKVFGHDEWCKFFRDSWKLAKMEIQRNGLQRVVE
jgi:hypothetical protein